VEAVLRRLRRLGYGVLVDVPAVDLSLHPDPEVADRIRMPVPSTAKAGPVLRAWKAAGLSLIARGLETREQFELCKTLGFDLYQGFFFRCPQLVTGRGIPAHKVILGRIMARLGDPQLETEELDGMIRQDPGLTYRLLVIANSALYAPPTVVSSLRQAMMMLGFERVRRILGVVAVAGVMDEPREVAFGAVQRARMCEVLGAATSVPQPSLFMVGLLSVMDALLGRPMSEVVSAIAVAGDLAEALLARGGEAGRVLAAVDAHERASWETVETLGFDTADVCLAWLEATAWAQDLWRNIEVGAGSA
jgi:EAL and modified HD-GYP domain-containing signal transduction protein